MSLKVGGIPVVKMHEDSTCQGGSKVVAREASFDILIDRVQPRQTTCSLAANLLAYHVTDRCIGEECDIGKLNRKNYWIEMALVRGFRKAQKLELSTRVELGRWLGDQSDVVVEKLRSHQLRPS